MGQKSKVILISIHSEGERRIDPCAKTIRTRTLLWYMTGRAEIVRDQGATVEFDVS